MKWWQNNLGNPVNFLSLQRYSVKFISFFLGGRLMVRVLLEVEDLSFVGFLFGGYLGMTLQESYCWCFRNPPSAAVDMENLRLLYISTGAGFLPNQRYEKENDSCGSFVLEFGMDVPLTKNQSEQGGMEVMKNCLCNIHCPDKRCFKNPPEGTVISPATGLDSGTFVGSKGADRFDDLLWFPGTSQTDLYIVELSSVLFQEQFESSIYIYISILTYIHIHTWF